MSHHQEIAIAIAISVAAQSIDVRGKMRSWKIKH